MQDDGFLNVFLVNMMIGDSISSNFLKQQEKQDRFYVKLQYLLDVKIIVSFQTSLEIDNIVGINVGRTSIWPI